MDAATPAEVFISYAPEDENWLQKLDGHLKGLKRLGLITVWDDRLVVPGTDWAQMHANHLESARLILLLISPHFINSDRCYDSDMRVALERQAAHEALVIPIRLCPVAGWQFQPFAHLQALPRGDHFISASSTQDEDNILANIVNEIHFTLGELPFLHPDPTPLMQQAVWNASFVDLQVPEFPNAHAWPRASLGDLLREPPQYGFRGHSSSSGFPVLRLSAVTSRPDFIIDEQEFVNIAQNKLDIRKYEIKSGDLLACSSHASPAFVGRFAFYQGYSGQMQSYRDPLVRFRVDTNKVLPSFSCAALNSPIAHKYVQSLQASTVGIWRISIENLKKILIPVPPLSEQHRIIAHLDSLQVQVDEFKRKQAEIAIKLNALQQSALDNIFREDV